MMRVQVVEYSSGLQLSVCGRLAGCWVSELEKCWRNTSATAVSVDLRGVTYIDPAGERLLESMHREGVRFLAAGVLVEGIVGQITGEPK